MKNRKSILTVLLLTVLTLEILGSAETAPILEKLGQRSTWSNYSNRGRLQSGSSVLEACQSYNSGASKMLKTLKLLQDYGGFKAGELIDVSDSDAQELISDSVAIPASQSDYGNTDATLEAARQAAEIVTRQFASEKRGVPFHSGNYAPEGWGAINPKKFWSAEGSIGSSFDTCSDFLTAVAGASQGKWDSRLAQQKDLTIGSNVEGGFLVPVEMANFVYSEMLESNPFMSRCTLLPMEHSSITVPFIAESSRLATGVHGIGSGIGPPHAAEAAALADISPKWGACQLFLHKIAGRCRVSNEMLEDSRMAMSVLLPRLFADALNFRFQHEVINGSGAGECLGILNAPATISVAKEAGQAADTIETANIVKMFARLLPEAQRNCVWLASLNTLPQLLTLTVNVGTGGSYVWLVGGDRGAALANAAPLTILGKPLHLTEHCPALGDQGDIIAFDPRAYAIGRKVGSSVRIETSEHYRFENDQTVFRAIMRVDGQPLQANAITPANGGDTLSSFVTLDERA